MLFELVLGVFAAMVGIMVAAWAIVLVTKNGGWTDVFWTWGTTVTLAAAALCPISDTAITWRQWLVAGFMALWGLRLGLYLTPRVASHGTACQPAPRGVTGTLRSRQIRSTAAACSVDSTSTAHAGG